MADSVASIERALLNRNNYEGLNALLLRLSKDDALDNLDFAQQVLASGIVPQLILFIISPANYDSLTRRKAVDVIERMAGLNNKDVTGMLIAFEAHTAIIKAMEKGRGAVDSHIIAAVTKMIHFPEHRDQLIESGLLHYLCDCCDGKHGMETYPVMEALTAALYKMCMTVPFLNGEPLIKIVPTLVSCTFSKSPKVVITALETLTAILAANPNTERIMLLINHGLTARLTELLYHVNTEVSTAALDVLRFMALGEENIKYILNQKGFYHPLKHLLASRTPYVQSTVIETIGNLARYSPNQIHAIAGIGLDNKLLTLQSTAALPIRVDAARCIFTILESARDQHRDALVGAGLIPLLARALVEFIDNTEGLLVTIQSVRYVVGARDALDQRNARQFNYYEGLENLRRLRVHKDRRVANAATQLVDDIQ